MKLADTLARLPEALIERLRRHPLVLPALQDGLPLEAALGGAGWARRWAEAADPLARELLLRIVRAYAAMPFGEEEAEARFRRETGRTGADVRVALARLRRDGAVFAVRKAWGERLLYVPADMAGLWPLVLSLTEADSGMEAEADAPPAEPAPASAGGTRLPLSMQLLAAWSDIRRHGLPLTAQGVPNRARASRLAAVLELTAEEAANAGLWPEAGRTAPANVELALDIGLRLGWLRREPGRLATADAPPAGWAELTPAGADAKLLDFAALRCAGQDPRLHWAAASLRGLAPGVWHLEREALRRMGEPDAQERAALDRWLALLAACGWAERGTAAGEPAFRWRIDPAPEALRAPEPEAEGTVYALPDLEVIVPPEARLGLRWHLELVAERQTADVVSTYRLSAEGCRRASEAGWRAETFAAWLEQASGAPLPPPAARALADWFGRLGKASLADVKLLRLAETELADRLARDPQAASWLLERLGDRAFAVRPDAVRELERRLRELGYPPEVPQPGSPPSEAAPVAGARRKGAASARSAAPGPSLGEGWLPDRQPLAIYEPDASLPEPEELFPGIGQVPAAWLRQPRSYHLSTRRQLVERALAWGAGLRVKRGDRWLEFVPEALMPADGGWAVRGALLRREPGESGVAAERLELPGDSLAELMIELPDSGGEPPWTNH